MIAWTKPICLIDKDGWYIGQGQAELDVVAKDGSYLMPSNGIDTELPLLHARQAARWNAPNWEYLPDYRGMAAYETTTGKQVTVSEMGDLPDTLTFVTPPELGGDTPFIWDGENWQINHEEKKQRDKARFKVAKNHKLGVLNAQAQDIVARASGMKDTPEFEVQTWVLQAQEAQAWANNPTAPCPILETIAQSRGVDSEILKAKALEKAKAYEMLAAYIAGQRQAFEDAINATKNEQELEQIDIVFKLPTQD